MEKKHPLLAKLFSLEVLTSLAVLFGVAVRLVQYFANPSIWVDEAALARSIITRSYSGFLERLDYNQLAPIGFLVVERFFVVLLGSGELALRLFPLLCGVFSIILFYFLCKKALDTFATCIGVLLFSVSSFLIYYSAEVKQYSTDVFCAVLCLLLFQCFLEKRRSVFFVAGMIVCCALCIFFSQVAVFVLAGISVGMFYHVIHSEFRSKMPTFVAFCVFWGAAFAVNYFIFLAPYEKKTNLMLFWEVRSGFLPLDNFKDFVLWFPKAFLGMLKNPCDFPKQSIVMPFLITGIYALYKNNRALLMAFVVTLGGAIAASSLKQFPFAERLILFAVPMVLLVIACGASYLVNSVWPKHKPVAICLVFFLIWSPVFHGFKMMRKPQMREHVRPLLSYVEKNAVEGDSVYLYHATKKAWQYYEDRFDLSVLEDIKLGQKKENQLDYFSEVEQYDNCSRVWFLFTHVKKGVEYDDRVAFLSAFNQSGRIIDRQVAEGAWLYLLDFRKENTK